MKRDETRYMLLLFHQTNESCDDLRRRCSSSLVRHSYIDDAVDDVKEALNVSPMQ